MLVNSLNPWNLQVHFNQGFEGDFLQQVRNYTQHRGFEDNYHPGLAYSVDIPRLNDTYTFAHNFFGNFSNRVFSFRLIRVVGEVTIEPINIEQNIQNTVWQVVVTFVRYERKFLLGQLNPTITRFTATTPVIQPHYNEETPAEIPGLISLTFHTSFFVHPQSAINFVSELLRNHGVLIMEVSVRRAAPPAQQ